MKNFGEILKERNILSDIELKKAYDKNPENPLEALINLGFLTLDTLIEYLDHELKVKREY